MGRRRVFIPTINEQIRDFEKIATLYDETMNNGDDITFDFSRCAFLRQNGCAVVGALLLYLEHIEFEGKVDWATVRPDIMTVLRKNQFASVFGRYGLPFTGNSIPFRQDREPDFASISKYLKKEWLGHGWINISSKLANVIASRLWEVYQNAFDHAGSGIGVVTCGQHYPNRHYLSLTCVDMGSGIPSKVRDYMEDPSLSAAKALEWAFGRGNSTCDEEEDVARGLGLTFLQRFIALNGGELLIVSQDGYARIAGEKVQYGCLENEFGGTIVNIMLKCDESYYQLKGE